MIHLSKVLTGNQSHEKAIVTCEIEFYFRVNARQLCPKKTFTERSVKLIGSLAATPRAIDVFHQILKNTWKENLIYRQKHFDGDWLRFSVFMSKVSHCFARRNLWTLGVRNLNNKVSFFLNIFMLI